MTTKRKKVKKVLDLREQALERRALELSQSKVNLQTAREDHSQESERMLVAERRRQELTSGPIDVSSWIEAEQWLAHRRTELGRADGRVSAAEATVKTAWHGVVEARIDKKRIELLDARLAQGEVSRENRIEQRLTDEIGQRNRKRED